MGNNERYLMWGVIILMAGIMAIMALYQRQYNDTNIDNWKSQITINDLTTDMLVTNRNIIRATIDRVDSGDYPCEEGDCPDGTLGRRPNSSAKKGP